MNIRKVLYLFVVWTLLWSLLPRESKDTANAGQNGLGNTLASTWTLLHCWCWGFLKSSGG